MGVIYDLKHGPQRHVLRPWRLTCRCRFETFPCPPVRMGIAPAAIRISWRLW